MPDDQRVRVRIVSEARDEFRAHSLSRSLEVGITRFESQQSRAEGSYPDYSLRVLHDGGDSGRGPDIITDVDGCPPCLIGLVEPVDDVTARDPYLALLAIVDVSDDIHRRRERAADQHHGAVERLPDLTGQCAGAVGHEDGARVGAAIAFRRPSQD